MATAAATFCDSLMSAASSAARWSGVWPFGSTTSSETSCEPRSRRPENHVSSSVALRRTTATKRMPG